MEAAIKYLLNRLRAEQAASTGMVPATLPPAASGSAQGAAAQTPRVRMPTREDALHVGVCPSEATNWGIFVGKLPPDLAKFAVQFFEDLFGVPPYPSEPQSPPHKRRRLGY